MAVSMHGLDLSFLKTKESRDHIRRERDRITESKRRVPNASKRSDLYPGVCGHLPDLDVAYNGGFVSPIDGTLITSRAHLREHNKRHDVVQTGDYHGATGREMTKKRMGYDPALIGHKDFSWGNPK